MIRQLACILHTKWVHDLKYESVIVGFWSEDNSEYRITVPYQLRDSIILMQNWLADKYDLYKKAEDKSREISRWFSK